MGDGSRDETCGPSPGEPMSGRWLAVVILALTMVGWFGLQTFQLVRERAHLRSLRENQESLLQQAQRVRGQLDSIARSTLELAHKGNQGAAVIVDQLARRGITINVNPPAQAPEGAAPK